MRKAVTAAVIVVVAVVVAVVMDVVAMVTVVHGGDIETLHPPAVIVRLAE